MTSQIFFAHFYIMIEAARNKNVTYNETKIQIFRFMFDIIT